MKYKVGDKVVINGGNTSVYTISAYSGYVEYPYRLENSKGMDMGIYSERVLIPAGNLLDPEEATEEFARLLDSGFYDESPIGITPEMMGVTDAVVKGERMRKDEPLREPTLAEERSEAYDRGYADGAEVSEEARKAFYHQGLDEGRDEAWETIRKLYRNYHDKLKRIFSNNEFSVLEVVMGYSASETIEKLKAYEKEQNTIKVGDEVICDGVKGIVIASKDIENYEYEVLEVDGNTKIWYAPTTHKTGRHFDQISEVLEQMKEEEPEVEHTMTGDEIARLFAEG